MKFKPLIFLFLLLLLLIISLINRPLILGFFMVDRNYDNPPDLIVLLEGGSWLFSPTRERIDKVVELYKHKSTKILVCAYPEFKDDVVGFLVSNGVKSEDIVKSQYVYNARGGTSNNVLEILEVLTHDEKYNFVEIVTSPYHERRVNIIVSNLMPESGINRPVHVSFAHIKDSDIYRTNTERYINLISHELLGIAGFYMQKLQHGTKN